MAATGWWSSPFVFTVIPGLVQAGFAGGFAWAVPLAAVASAAVTIPSFKNTAATIQLATQGSAEYLLAAMVAGYGRRLFGEAEERTTTALDRLRGLTETNRLLQQLNALAQTLPASLDLRETVSETIGQIRSLLRPDATAIFLWDSSLTQWSVALAEGEVRERLRHPVVEVARDARALFLGSHGAETAEPHGVVDGERRLLSDAGHQLKVTGGKAVACLALDGDHAHQ